MRDLKPRLGDSLTGRQAWKARTARTVWTNEIVLAKDTERVFDESINNFVTFVILERARTYVLCRPDHPDRPDRRVLAISA